MKCSENKAALLLFTVYPFGKGRLVAVFNNTLPYSVLIITHIWMDSEIILE